MGRCAAYLTCTRSYGYSSLQLYFASVNTMNGKQGIESIGKLFADNYKELYNSVSYNCSRGSYTEQLLAGFVCLLTKKAPYIGVCGLGDRRDLSETRLQTDEQAFG